MDTNRPHSIPQEVWRRIAYYNRTARLLEYLKHHPDEPLSLAKASAIACMERTAFSRFFSQRIGMTFSEFLRAYRVGVAKRRMLQHNSSLEEIARSVGFCCFATFERQFRRETGMSPSRFRAEALVDNGLRPAASVG